MQTDACSNKRRNNINGPAKQLLKIWKYLKHFYVASTPSRANYRKYKINTRNKIKTTHNWSVETRHHGQTRLCDTLGICIHRDMYKDSWNDSRSSSVGNPQNVSRLRLEVSFLKRRPEEIWNWETTCLSGTFRHDWPGPKLVRPGAGSR